ncbi:hypothetical protein BN871_JT_00040 [Paenibacillus sp. P22]|nr:hypothetical protein BN871_JT_00040 [Paenibacillus sp. P22]
MFSTTVLRTGAPRRSGCLPWKLSDRIGGRLCGSGLKKGLSSCLWSFRSRLSERFAAWLVPSSLCRVMRPQVQLRNCNQPQVLLAHDNRRRGDMLQAEGRRQLAGSDGFRAVKQAAPVGEQANGRFRPGARFPDGGQGDAAMALGQPLAVRSHQQRNMGEPGRGEAERFIEQQLAGSGVQQIAAAQHIRHAHQGIVHRYGQLVAEDAVRPPDDKVASCARRRMLMSGGQVVEGYDTRRIDGQPQRGLFGLAALLPLRLAKMPACSRIGGAFRREAMRGAGDGGELRAAAKARVEPSLSRQPVQSFPIERKPLALRVRAAGAADVRAFVPVDAEPAQIRERCFRVFGSGAGAVDILHPQDERSSCGSYLQPCQERGPCIAKMHESRRGRSESSDCDSHIFHFSLP